MSNLNSSYNGKNGFGLLRLSGTRIIYPNFAGQKTDFNNEGDRNFGAAVDPDLAEQLREDGFRVKTLPAYADDPDSTPTDWIKVKVNFNSRIPPKVWLIKVDPDDPDDKEKMVQTKLTEDTIGLIDILARSRAIMHVDMNIRPSRYPDRPNRPGGISCYLDALYVTIVDDPLERKYRNIRMTDESPMPDDDEMPFEE